MILITGATGTNGSEITKQLLAQGQKVRILVRNSQKANDLISLGAEAVEGDFSNRDRLQEALNGIEKALMLPPLVPEMVEFQNNFVEAAKTQNLQHLVKFSGMGASVEAPIEIGRLHGQGEQLVEQSGIPFTYLRPTSFMQNTLAFAGTIKSEGVFYQPAGEAKISHVDARDIAAVAVKILTEEGHFGKAYEITGPDPLSFDEIAQKISAVVGKPVQYIDVSSEAFKESLMSWGQPEWLAQVVTELYEKVYKKGWASSVTDTIKNVAQKDPISFDQFVHDYRQVFSN